MVASPRNNPDDGAPLYACRAERHGIAIPIVAVNLCFRLPRYEFRERVIRSFTVEDGAWRIEGTGRDHLLSWRPEGEVIEGSIAGPGFLAGEAVLTELPAARRSPPRGRTSEAKRPRPSSPPPPCP